MKDDKVLNREIKLISKNLSKKYSYFGIELEQIQNIIDKVFASNNEEITNDTSLLVEKSKAQCYLIMNELASSKFYKDPVKVLCSFISKNLSVTNDYQTSLIELKKISSFLKPYAILLSNDVSLKLVEESNKLYEIISFIVSLIILPDNTLDKESLIYNDIINDFIKAYCFINKIKINGVKNHDKFYLDADEDIEKSYLDEVNPTLIPKDEKEKLVIAASNGDKEAKKKLAKSCLRLVVKAARKYENNGVDFLDLVQVGNLALIEAIDKYDYKKGGSFIFFISCAISRDIIRTVKSKKRIIDHEMIETDYLLDNEDEYFYSLRCLDETVEDLAIKKVLEKEIHSLLERSIISKKELKILKMSYGLDGYEAYTLRYIGDNFGVSAECIRQIRCRALKKIKRLRGIETFSNYMDKPTKTKEELISYRKKNKLKLYDKREFW